MVEHYGRDPSEQFIMPYFFTWLDMDPKLVLNLATSEQKAIELGLGRVIDALLAKQITLEEVVYDPGETAEVVYANKVRNDAIEQARKEFEREARKSNRPPLPAGIIPYPRTIIDWIRLQAVVAPYPKEPIASSSLAKLMQVTRPYVSALVNGRSSVPDDQRKKLIRHFADMRRITGSDLDLFTNLALALPQVNDVPLEKYPENGLL